MRAKAKAIFFGEHAVVYGYTAISIPINLHSYAKVEESEDIIINLPNLKKSLDFKEAKKDKDFRYIIKAIELLKINKPFSLTINSNIPISCGLGSSASTVIASIRALSKFFNLNLSPNEIVKIAYNVEKEVQGRASITDSYTIGLERALKIKNNSYEFVDDFAKTVRKDSLYIAYVEERKKRTAELVNIVAKRENKDIIFKEINEIAEEALTSDLDRIKDLMIENHKLLSKLGVSTKKIDRVVKLAKKSGCGAKLTGAGGGGCVIILGEIDDKIEKEAIKVYKV
ncbi:mevalonate kinase [Methanocaldococcus sp.]